MNRTTLNNAINSLIALGGTNTQAGIKAADKLFNDVLTADKANYNHLILLSDGLPTQSYQIKSDELGLNPTNATFIKVNDDYYTKRDLAENIFDYPNTAGPGSSEFTQIGRTGWFFGYTYYYYDHSKSAISQAKFYQDGGNNRTLWTIALATISHGNDILKDIATLPANALQASASDLNTKLQQIAGSINAAAKNIKVTDPIAPGFEIIQNAAVADITTSQGTKTYTNRVINWDVGALSTPISSGSNIRYVAMTYRISIIPDIITIATPSDGLYPTNGITSLIYQDTSNQTQTRYFTVPKVNPIFLKVKKVFIDSEGKPIALADPFLINILSSPRTDLPYKGFGRFNKNFSLVGNSPVVTSTELRLADTYTISETTLGYEVTYEVNGAQTNTFIVSPPNPGDTGQNDIEVLVTNKLLGKIVLKKLLVDIDGNTLAPGNPLVYPFNQDFTFTITGPDGYSATRTVKPNIDLTVSGLKYGTYTVTETNLPPNFIFVTSNPADGKVTLSTGKKQSSVIITNTLKKDVVVSKLVTGNLGDRNKIFTFTATLTKGTGAPLSFPLSPANSVYTVSGNTATFYLKHGENVKLIGLPVGAKLAIVETANTGYTITVKKDESTLPYPGLTVTIPITQPDTTVEFTNYKNTIIDTGVTLDSLPYIMILIIMISGGLGGLLWKRKRRDYD